MREAGDRTGRIKQATSMPNCDSLKLNISSKIILLSNMCLMQNLFSVLILKTLKTFCRLFVEGIRAMLTSRLANKKYITAIPLHLLVIFFLNACCWHVATFLGASTPPTVQRATVSRQFILQTNNTTKMVFPVS